VTTVSDSFTRADNLSLGPAWAYVAGGSVGGVPANTQILSNAAAPGSGETAGAGPYPTSFAVYLTPLATADQIVQATLAAIAPSTSVLSITACTANTPSAGQATYTYTLTSGAALQTNQEVIITGMQNAGSNITYALTLSATGSTFVIANGAAVTESGSSGTGITATDSLGVHVARCSADGLNSYFTLIGNNSGYFSGGNDNRQWARELWKNVAGTGTDMNFAGVLTATDTVNDIYTLLASGKKISYFRNSSIIASVDDTAVTAKGYVGIVTQSANVSGHATPFTGQTFAGVTGTRWKNWAARDLGSLSLVGGWTKQAEDTFNAAQDYVGFWTQQGQFPNNMTINAAGAVAGSIGYGSSASAPSSGVQTGRSWANDQAASIVIYAMSGNTAAYCLVRANTLASWTAYFLQVITTSGLGAGTYSVVRVVSSAQTVLKASTAITVSQFDCFRLEAQGTTITAYQNGAVLFTTTDSGIASGNPGIIANANFGAVNAVGIAYWSADEFTGLFNIGGNTGVGGVTVNYTGTASGSVTSDAFGNYSISGLAVGTYTLTPSKTGIAFTPPAATDVLSTANVTQNFSIAGGDLGPAYDLGFRL